MSAIAKNRKQYFDLVEAAEQQLNCEIDDLVLQAEIDGTYAGREDVSQEEARDLLMKVSRPRKAARVFASGGK